MSRLNAPATAEDALHILERSPTVHAVQRNILMLYALLGGVQHVVRKEGYLLAQHLGMTPAAFSRARRALVEQGWLEEVDKVGNIPYYRLSDKATGRTTVVRLHA